MMKPIVVKAAVNNVAAIKNLKKNLLFLRKMSILAKFVWFHEKFQNVICFPEMETHRKRQINPS